MRIGQLLLLVTLAWAVIATCTAAFLYVENQGLAKQAAALRSRVVVVNVLIDYGNGTRVWFNSTVLRRGATVLDALMAVAKVNYTLGSYGAFVNSINGVANRVVSKNEGYYWMWYIYDRTSRTWRLGEVASNAYELSDGDVIMWKYQKVKW